MHEIFQNNIWQELSEGPVSDKFHLHFVEPTFLTPIYKHREEYNADKTPYLFKHTEKREKCKDTSYKCPEIGFNFIWPFPPLQ